MRKIAIFLLAAYAISVWAAPCFDDKSLAQLNTRQPAGSQGSQGSQGSLIYVWSPRMVLSAQHAASAQRQAQQLGLAFVPVHDAQLGEAEIQATRARLAHAPPAQHTVNAQLAASARALASSQSLCAPSLLERDALRHFPTAFVVPPGGPVHQHTIIGAMPEAAWAQSIAQRLHNGKHLLPIPVQSEMASPEQFQTSQPQPTQPQPNRTQP
jgi:hypothetical protein